MSWGVQVAREFYDGNSTYFPISGFQKPEAPKSPAKPPLPEEMDEDEELDVHAAKVIEAHAKAKAMKPVKIAHGKAKVGPPCMIQPACQGQGLCQLLPVCD